jgi:hypothetical protein
MKIFNLLSVLAISSASLSLAVAVGKDSTAVDALNVAKRAPKPAPVPVKIDEGKDAAVEKRAFSSFFPSHVVSLTFFLFPSFRSGGFGFGFPFGGLGGYDYDARYDHDYDHDSAFLSLRHLFSLPSSSTSSFSRSLPCDFLS